MQKRRLQWGRSYSERKTLRSKQLGLSWELASMGPLLFRAEDVDADNTLPDKFIRFNGAALIQSGRPTPTRTTDKSGQRLQWGRSYSERKTSGSLTSGLQLPELQWGRSYSERKTQKCEVWRNCHSSASMGPLLFRAEDETNYGEKVIVFMASMGPLLFRAEDCPRCNSNSKGELQGGFRGVGGSTLVSTSLLR